MSGSSRPWSPSIGERVILVASGETGTVRQLAPTEWGLLCDVELDPPAGARGSGARRVHAATELRPLDG